MGREQARSAFDLVADAYDAARPDYPAELWADIEAVTRLGPGSRVLEVGCGTGQATRQLVAYGCDVDAVELGPALAATTRRNHPDVRVHVGDFETIALAISPVDVVLSAMAWHWLDPSVSYRRAAALLRPGGWLVLVTTIPVAGGTEEELMDGIAAIDRRWSLPDPVEVDEWAFAGGDIAAVWARVDRAFEPPPDVTALFAPPEVRTHRRTLTYDRDRYVRLIESQSSFALMDPDDRRRALDRIGQLVDEAGGTVIKPFVAVTAMSMRR